MEVDEYNKSLYWQDAIARLQMGMGIVVLFFSVILFLFKEFILVIIFFVVGLFLMIRGGQRQMDYKRKSGYIIHNE